MELTLAQHDHNNREKKLKWGQNSGYMTHVMVVE